MIYLFSIEFFDVFDLKISEDVIFKDKNVTDVKTIEEKRKDSAIAKRKKGIGRTRSVTFNLDDELDQILEDSHSLPISSRSSISFIPKSTKKLKSIIK